MPESAHIAFASPAAARPGTYAIVHLRNAGEALAWIEEKPTTSARHGAVLMTEIDSSGLYALVRLAKTGQREPSPLRRSRKVPR